MILTSDSPIKTHDARIRWAFWYSVALAAAGSMIHQLSNVNNIFIINKVQATPSWGLWSSAFTIWIFIIIYWLIDIRGWKGWTKIVELAGNNALFAYILAPIFYAIFELIALAMNGFNFYNYLGTSFISGFFRAIFFSFAMIWLAGYLRKKGFWLKL
jgi:predicted acyltransferase